MLLGGFLRLTTNRVMEPVGFAEGRLNVALEKAPLNVRYCGWGKLGLGAA